MTSSSSSSSSNAPPPPAPADGSTANDDGGSSSSSSSSADALARAERLQGERFLQLSRRCHEQNWARVHALAEEIVRHKRAARSAAAAAAALRSGREGGGGRSSSASSNAAGGGSGPDDGGGDEGGGGGDDGRPPPTARGPRPPGPKRDAREGSISASGEVYRAALRVAADDDEAVGGGEGAALASAGAPPPPSASAPSSARASRSLLAASTTPLSPPPPSAPRMLSTCLGTASPLAWTCRYSAPSRTVRLVLGLDPSAVRRCLPQLGTPLHECAGRPRPLRRRPLRSGGRWRGGLVGNEACSTPLVPAEEEEEERRTKEKKNEKKKKKKKHCLGPKPPRILRGLREWRRTVRTLIKADEALAREDARACAALLLREASKKTSEGEKKQEDAAEWRRAVRAMVSESKGNVDRVKEAGGGSGSGGGGGGGGRGDAPSPPRDASEPPRASSNRPPASSSRPSARAERTRRWVRAALAQDADGNTPLHFMVRGAASPAFGGARWQGATAGAGGGRRRGSGAGGDEEFSDDDSDSDDDDDRGGTEAGEGEGDDEMDVDGGGGAGSSGEAAGAAARWAPPSSGGSSSSWDGVRWCMEAHLRRVERRAARGRVRRGAGGRGDEAGAGDAAVDAEDALSDGERRARTRRALADVRISSPGPRRADDDGDAAMDDDDDEKKPAAAAPTRLPAKRKSLDVGGVPASGSVKSSRSASRGPSSRVDSAAGEGSEGGGGAPQRGRDAALRPRGPPRGGPRRGRRTSRDRRGYRDDDERQDCAHDPLLGAVRDLVASCPEAAGTPDHREYEETPLIVALKCSIYVVAEPHDREFRDLDDAAFAPGGWMGGGGLLPGGVAGGLALLQQPPPPPGDGLGGFGGIVLGGGEGGGGGGGGGGGLGGAFPFPELGALIHNRGFNMFRDDEAMMAVLRGHGRRVTREGTAGRRRSSAAALRAADRAASRESGLPDDGTKDAAKEEGAGRDGDDDDDESSACSSVSDEASLDGDDDPRGDAFRPLVDEGRGGAATSSSSTSVLVAADPPGAPRPGLLPPRRGPRYDYRTALEYRIFSLVRIMLSAYPRAACLMISDYTPLHSAVFHGRCPDTIRLLLDAEARFLPEEESVGAGGDDGASSSSDDGAAAAAPPPPPPPRLPVSSPEPCPPLPGPAALCTNTRGELPLHFACMRNEPARSVRLLAEADPRAALVRDASGRTPLRWLWIRFVDGLLDRFGGRGDAQQQRGGRAGERADRRPPAPAFREQEGGTARNFPNPGRSVLGGGDARPGGGRGGPSVRDAFVGSERPGRRKVADDDDARPSRSEDSMFVFDTEYLRRTRDVDRTVDFLRMRHVPLGFESVEDVAAEHAITVLLKLQYLQQRRNRQLEAYDSAAQASPSENKARATPPEVSMSVKEEFILYAFEKFTALVYASFVASEAQERTFPVDAALEAGSQAASQECDEDDDAFDSAELPSRKKLWQFLPYSEDFPSKTFFLVHEACGSCTASCPAAVAKIFARLFSDQLYLRDDDGRLPLHRVALRGVGWDPPASDAAGGLGPADSARSSAPDETLTLLREVLEGSHEEAPRTRDGRGQLPLHCAIDSLVASLVVGKRRRASLHAEARVALQRRRRAHVDVAAECLFELLRANSSALQCPDGRTGLLPFMQAALSHDDDPAQAVVCYTSDLSRRPGFDVGVGFSPLERDVVDEPVHEAEADHLTIIYYLLREDPSVINSA